MGGAVYSAAMRGLVLVILQRCVDEDKFVDFVLEFVLSCLVSSIAFCFLQEI